MEPRLKKVSKFLSLVLRHKPETIGLSLDEGGWVPVDELLRACAENNVELTEGTLNAVVEQNDKSRFVVRDGRIRASQGHSIEVELGLEPVVPPDRLYHGTATRFLDSILVDGLVSQSRQFVHLSADEKTAVSVGKRHGKPVVLVIDAKAMHQTGMRFYFSENGVWLTKDVPPVFVRTREEKR